MPTSQPRDGRSKCPHCAVLARSLAHVSRISALTNDVSTCAWDESVSIRAIPGAPHAWFWTLGSARDLVSVARHLATGVHPVSSHAQPWVSVVRRHDGTVVASVNSTVNAGAFHRAIPDRGQPLLVFSPSLAAVMRYGPEPIGLSQHFLQSRLGLVADAPTDTPYKDAARLPPGFSAIWHPSVTQNGASMTTGSPPCLTQWCGPAAWPDPDVEGPDAIIRYRDTFDAAVDELLTPGEPICATLSGGLDSSFMVSSLVRHATTENPVHAFVHSPLPAACLSPSGNWDPDDYPIALAMTRRYSQRLVVHRVLNEHRRSPLDTAVQTSKKQWYPGVNIGNQVWLHDIAAAAARLGASRLFIGEGGNPAFSYDHPYAVAYHARRRQWGDIRTVGVPLTTEVMPGIRTGFLHLGRRLAATTRSLWRQHDPPVHPARRFLTLATHTSQRRTPSRAGYLDWLSANSHRNTAMAYPGWESPLVDPFRSPSVLNLAAAITPATWARGGHPRGFARAVATGRVPDEIRLRTRRGGQAMDTWFVISGQRVEFEQQVQLLTNDPDLGSYIDGPELHAEVASWPW